MIFGLTNCATTGQRKSNLDKIIENAGETISSRLKNGSRVAVVSFFTPSERLSEYAMDELSEYLVSTYKFDVVERQYIDLVRKELDFQLSGEVSDESAQSIGKFLGAQYIITGSFARINKSWKIRTSTIHVETAKKEVVTNSSINMKDEDIQFLIRNGTPYKAEDKNHSKFDCIWRSGETLWTFDNNLISCELENKFFMTGTYSFSNTELHITLLRYKENIADFSWSTINPTIYGSFQYTIEGNKMSIKGRMDDTEINAILLK